MNIVNMHKLTMDSRSKVERITAFKKIFLDFKTTNDVKTAMEGLKICLSLVNDVIEYSQPITLDPYYLKYAKSFISDRYGYWDRFEYDHAEFLENGLSNDLAPRHFCKDWFATIVGVLVLNGFSLNEVESCYYDYVGSVEPKQLTMFDFV